jgi:hypothetical protein
MRASSVIGRRLSVVAVSCGVLLVMGACGGKSDESRKAASDTLSERQRDSILAKSSIPGASAVGKAMTAADSTSARVRASDTVQ